MSGHGIVFACVQAMLGRHPNVVALLGVVTEDSGWSGGAGGDDVTSLPMLAMEYVEGGSLKQALQTDCLSEQARHCLSCFY